jgi:hypothetical protein
MSSKRMFSSGLFVEFGRSTARINTILQCLFIYL